MIFVICVIAVLVYVWLHYWGFDIIKEYRCKHQNLTENFIPDTYTCEDCGKKFDKHPKQEGGDVSGGSDTRKSQER